jgi:NDP-sugar pyrophosphorylase family protein
MSGVRSQYDVHAVTLATGIGRRLRPLADETPKTPLEVGRASEWYEAAFDRLAPDQPPEIVEVRDDSIATDDRDDPRTTRRIRGEG